MTALMVKVYSQVSLLSHSFVYIKRDNAYLMKYSWEHCLKQSNVIARMVFFDHKFT